MPLEKVLALLRTFANEPAARQRLALDKGWLDGCCERHHQDARLGWNQSVGD